MNAKEKDQGIALVGSVYALFAHITISKDGRVTIIPTAELPEKARENLANASRNLELLAQGVESGEAFLDSGPKCVDMRPPITLENANKCLPDAMMSLSG